MSAAKLSEMTVQNCIDPITADNKIMTILDVQNFFGGDSYKSKSLNLADKQ